MSQSSARAGRDGAVRWSPDRRHAGSTFRCRPGISGSGVAAARSFYVDALGGRQVWRTGRAEVPESLWFLVGGTLVEVGADAGAAVPAAIALEVDSPDDVAERCWDAGFTVRLRHDGIRPAEVSVVDPFGRRIDLISRRTITTRPGLASGGEEKR